MLIVKNKITKPEYPIYIQSITSRQVLYPSRYFIPRNIPKFKSKTKNKQMNNFVLFLKSNITNPKIKIPIQTDIYGIKSISTEKNEIIESIVVIAITFTRVYQFIKSPSLYSIDYSIRDLK